MAVHAQTRHAAVGFRAKTGRAIAVVLAAESGAPAFLWRGEVSLLNPDYRAPEGPYHEVMELPWTEAEVAVQPLVTKIQKASAAAVRNLVDEMRARDVIVRAAGVVGSPPKDLARIGNEHIRAHAAEGVLFRRVLEVAATEIGLPYLAFTEAELKDQGNAMKQLGRVAGAPWRTDERLAASAAWLALRGRS